jgi:hypothetical protein
MFHMPAVPHAPSQTYLAGAQNAESIGPDELYKSQAASAYSRSAFPVAAGALRQESNGHSRFSGSTIPSRMRLSSISIRRYNLVPVRIST